MCHRVSGITRYRATALRQSSACAAKHGRLTHGCFALQKATHGLNRASDALNCTYADLPLILGVAIRGAALGPAARAAARRCEARQRQLPRGGSGCKTRRRHGGARVGAVAVVKPERCGRAGCRGQHLQQRQRQFPALQPRR